jgi:uncharacterized cupin superfamily protein
VEVFNLATGELGRVLDEQDGWHARLQRIGGRIGAAQIGGTVFELEDGQRAWPYHYHHGVEEWVLVIDGTPTVRTPDGPRQLAPGDVVCFPSGPDGAHDVRGPGRVLIVSADSEPSIAVYPDSDKVGMRPGRGSGDRLDFRRADAVGYWDGER